MKKNLNTLGKIKKYTMTTETPTFKPIRGDKFKEFITTLLSRGKIKPKYMDLLTNEESMRNYTNAFTAKDINSTNNYENFENMGDVTANKFIVWYAYQRFPQLYCTQGVSIVARLRINFGAKVIFARIAERLGFWPYIDQTVEKRATQMKTLLEDCFEAFIGCTEYLLDKYTRVGVGYAVVYDILESIYDEEKISLNYTDLYDPITRLKELFDKFGQKLGGYWVKKDKTQTPNNFWMTTTTIYFAPGVKKAVPDKMKDAKMQDVKIPQKSWKIIGEGYAANQAESEQKASENAIKTLESIGWVKETPEIFAMFCQ